MNRSAVQFRSLAPHTSCGSHFVWFNRAVTFVGTMSKPYAPLLATELSTTCRGVAQLGSAFASGVKGRRFKSCHPDQNVKVCNKNLDIFYFSHLLQNYHNIDTEEKIIIQLYWKQRNI